MNFFRIAYKGKSKILKKLCELSNALVDAVSSFDADGDGVVDNAAKVNGHTVACDVPENAVFTDTTYTFELSDGKLTIRSSEGTKQVLTLPVSGSGGSSGEVTEVGKPSFDHIKNVAAVTKLALDVDDGRGFITYPANSAVHLKKSSITKSDPDIRLKVVEVQLSDGTLSTDMDTYNGFRFYATTGKCIVDSEDNGTTSYPDADQIGHFKFADGIANDETTLMAYNQATLKYKYLMVYVED